MSKQPVNQKLIGGARTHGCAFAFIAKAQDDRRSRPTVCRVTHRCLGAQPAAGGGSNTGQEEDRKERQQEEQRTHGGTPAEAENCQETEQAKHMWQKHQKELIHYSDYSSWLDA